MIHTFQEESSLLFISMLNLEDPVRILKYYNSGWLLKLLGPRWVLIASLTLRDSRFSFIELRAYHLGLSNIHSICIVVLR